MPIDPKKPKNHSRPRRCKYCRATFVPERLAGKEAKFCCAAHRKAYWRFGGLPFDKMKDQIMKDVRKEVATFLDAEVELRVSKYVARLDELKRVTA